MHYCRRGSEIFSHCSLNSLPSAVLVLLYLLQYFWHITEVWTFNANISTEHICKVNAQLINDHIFEYVFFQSCKNS